MKNTIFTLRQAQIPGRMELPDFLRGGAMLLVLLHHSDVPWGGWILAFHMPLMFLLSGYTASLRSREQPFGTFLKNRFLRLVVPYLLFEGLNLAVWSLELILQGGWQDVTEAVTAIAVCLNTDGYMGYYGRLWFWPCMFVSDVLFYGLRKLTRGSKTGLLLSAGVMLGLSWCSCNLLPSRLPFTVDTACFAAFFLILGYVLGDKITEMLYASHFWRDMLCLLGLLAVLWVGVIHGGGLCLMFVNQYGSYPGTVAAACSGSFAFLILAKWLYRLLEKKPAGKTLILWYGRNSLVTFPVHLSIKIAMYKLVPYHLRPWYVLLVVMLAGNIPIVNFITNYLPFMQGQLPKKKTAC